MWISGLVRVILARLLLLPLLRIHLFLRAGELVAQTTMLGMVSPVRMSFSFVMMISWLVYLRNYILAMILSGRHEWPGSKKCDVCWIANIELDFVYLYMYLCGMWCKTLEVFDTCHVNALSSSSLCCTP